MTREDAIAYLQEKYDYCKSFYDLAAHPEEDYPEMTKYLQALQIALAALRLRPVSWEWVEKVWRGEWRDLHGDKLVGIDDVGQDVYRHYHYSVCKKCGKGIAAKSNFCPYCGDAKTDEAVDMVMERLEEMKNC